MAFDESLAARIRGILSRRKGLQEKKMFGGLAFLLKGHLCVGVWKDSLVVRLGAEEGDVAMRDPHVKPFDITGQALKGWILVGPEALEDDDYLGSWVALAVKFVAGLPAK
jgi:hypothetical protein